MQIGKKKNGRHKQQMIWVKGGGPGEMKTNRNHKQTKKWIWENRQWPPKKHINTLTPNITMKTNNGKNVCSWILERTKQFSYFDIQH